MPGSDLMRSSISKLLSFSLFGCVLALLAVAPVVLAQTGSSPAPTRAPRPEQKNDSSGDQQGPTETLKVNVKVVQLFFNVKDKKGALIPNLTKDDFEIFEDGKPQTIKYFSAESNLPLTLGILIDSSGSQQNVLDMEKQVGGSFLSQILRDKDEAFVISFDIDTELLQDYTNDVHRLKAALNKAKINVDHASGGIPGIGGGPIPNRNPAGTVLYDAVYLSSHDMLAKEIGRKAMILLTDGQDEGSKLKIKDAIEAAQKGADLHRTIDGEDPDTKSPDSIRQWLKTYAELLALEADLLDMLAERLPGMSNGARREAEDTNLPVIVSQLERFRYRLDFWKKRKEELDPKADS